MNDSVSQSPDKTSMFSWARCRQSLSWLTVYLAVAGALQFYVVSVPMDADTYYHVAVGRLIREHGMLHAFPWTPFSWLANHYADKELLFHLLFVPFASLDYLLAAKIVGTLLGGALLFSLYLILKAEKVSFAGVWALLILVTSDLFLFRFATVRPHLLSIALALLMLWAAIRGRFPVLALVAALYPWSYVAFWQIPLIILFSVGAAHILSGKRLDWKTVAVPLLGVAVGLALHPNTVNLMKFNWICMANVLFENSWNAQAGLALGKELLPFTGAQWVKSLLGCVIMVIVGIVAGWRERRENSGLLAYAIAALIFGVLTARSGRFQEYFVPFSAATVALASRSINVRGLIIAVFAASLIYQWPGLSYSLHKFGTYREPMPSSIATYLQEQIPAGSRVFTTEWDYTGNLMLALPDRAFVVALDPTLFSINDPQLYRLWYSLPRRPQPNSAEIIRRNFGARFVISFWQEPFAGFYNQLSMEPGVKTILVSDYWMVFDLGGP